jgi:WS/DGAT/MGAT family acyltransferase
LVSERIATLPRLRQRLTRTPVGCGGPIWVDDDGFDVGQHVREAACDRPGDEQALLDTALRIVLTPLPRTAPLWGVTLVAGVDGARSALVVVLHHVLADGVGGLAVLAGLVDGVPTAADPSFPRPRPPVRQLAADALRARLRAVARVPESTRQLRRSMTSAGGVRPPAAVRCSLNQPTGRHRSIAVVRVDLGALREAVHRYGATANDAVLVAVAGALRSVMATRGESLDVVTVAVPMSVRAAGDERLGNLVTPLLVPVPATGALADRLLAVGTTVQGLKAAAHGPPPIAVLGWLFRPLARLGGYRWYMNHQRRMHTLVSHVRGPVDRLGFGGATIVDAVPLGVGDDSNMPVYFEVLSYAGTLAVAVVADPEHFPEVEQLSDTLRRDLHELTRPASPGAPGAG